MAIPFGQYEHFNQIGPPKILHFHVMNYYFEF
jgi:hypothetical protein